MEEGLEGIGGEVGKRALGPGKSAGHLSLGLCGDSRGMNPVCAEA